MQSVGATAAELTTDDDNVVGQIAELSETSSITRLIDVIMEFDSADEDGYVQNFVVETVPSYTDIQFRQHFRMTRHCFEVRIL